MRDYKKLLLDALVTANNEVEKCESILSGSTNLSQMELGFLFLQSSRIFDEVITHIYYTARKVEIDTELGNFSQKILRRCFGVLNKCSKLVRFHSSNISMSDKLYPFWKKHGHSYYHLQYLFGTSSSKAVISEFLTKMSTSERKILSEYFRNYENLEKHSWARDKAYQAMRFNLSSKIVNLELIGLTITGQTFNLKNTALATPFYKKFGFRKKYMTAKKLLSHSDEIQATVIGKITKSQRFALAGSKQSLTLMTKTHDLNDITNMTVLVTGKYDGRRTFELNQYEHYGAYGWLFEFFALSSFIERFPMMSGSPVIEFI